MGSNPGCLPRPFLLYLRISRLFMEPSQIIVELKYLLVTGKSDLAMTFVFLDHGILDQNLIGQ